MLLTPKSRRLTGAAVLSVGLALSAGVTAPTVNAAPDTADGVQIAAPKAMTKAQASKALRRAVKPKAVQAHLDAFARIARKNGNTRVSGSSGYNNSKNYVVRQLKRAGYKPQVQAFDFAFFQENSASQLSRTAPSAKNYANGTDFATMDYSGSGTATGNVTAVDTTGAASDTSTSGCEAADFAGFPSGNVALIQRGTCDFGLKAANAKDAGASGVIIFNRGTAGNTDAIAGTLGAPADLPVVGASYATGQELLTAGTAVRIKTDTVSEIRKTYNVIAQTKRGKDKRVIMAGAHLDSVGEGPGINDNGSGSAALLAVAKQMKAVKNKNSVRFAWWGAEESGLLGAEHYVGQLANSPAKINRIKLYLNFDMVGSPNFVRFVYDGNNSSFGEDAGAAVAPAGSGKIERVFNNYFNSRKMKTDPTAFDGRSDYGPFIDQGVPAGGLFTGAEGLKTKAQARKYGGQAGKAYDPCYHQRCDGRRNINKRALRQMTGAIAHAIAVYSIDTMGIKKSPAPTGRVAPRVAPGAKGGLHPEHAGLTR